MHHVCFEYSRILIQCLIWLPNSANVYVAVRSHSGSKISERHNLCKAGIHSASNSREFQCCLERCWSRCKSDCTQLHCVVSRPKIKPSHSPHSFLASNTSMLSQFERSWNNLHNSLAPDALTTLSAWRWENSTLKYFASEFLRDFHTKMYALLIGWRNFVLTN